MNEHPPFTIILRWSEKQNAYVGQVEDLVGVEGTGSTYEEALAATLEAIRWWQEMSTKQSTQPPTQPENEISH